MAGSSRVVELNINNIRERIFDLRWAKAESLELQVLARAKIRITLLEDYLSVDYLMDIYLNETLYKDVVDSGKIENFEEAIKEAVNKELKNYREHQNERIKKVKILKNKDTEECNNAIEPTKEMLDNLQDYLDNISSEEKKASKKIANPSKPKQEKKDDGEKKVFIVHGHDEGKLRELEILLLKLGVETIILQDQDSGGDTLSEALDKRISKESDLVIVLMTPDDVGRAKDEKELKPRARQNVIYEMGMARVGVGKERVFLIKSGDLEIHSDIKGVLYAEYKNSMKDIASKLIDRLKKVGFKFTEKQLEKARR